ncbi:MAG TPA: hypothetical protein VHG08_11320 [Longimicrobium sp.]|nr:hypothetical protein [Longimicrobium sp.]
MTNPLADKAPNALGSAHGRFQVLHNEHLEYLLEAKRRCQHLLVGITAYDLNFGDSDNEDHRTLATNNPLTYYERQLLIREALRESGVALTDFTVVPFPIEHPLDLPNFIPVSATCYTTLREPWNSEKITRIRQLGYNVEVVIEGAKAIEGVVLRRMIVEKDDRWKQLVPPSTVRLVAEFGLEARLRTLLSQT